MAIPKAVERRRLKLLFLLTADRTPAQSSNLLPDQRLAQLCVVNVPPIHEEAQTHGKPKAGAKYAIRSIPAASSISDESAIERFLKGSRR